MSFYSHYIEAWREETGHSCASVSRVRWDMLQPSLPFDACSILMFSPAQAHSARMPSGKASWYIPHYKVLLCGLVTSCNVTWLCRLGSLDRDSIWPWFGSTGVGSCRVFLAFAVFQNKLHGFSLHQLHPKYLLLQFSRMQQPLWQCCWASVPSHTSNIRRSNMKANLLYGKETKWLVGACVWFPEGCVSLANFSDPQFLKEWRKLWKEIKPEGEKNQC